MTTRLFVKKLCLPVLIGVHPQEREKPQQVRFDFWVDLDRRKEAPDHLDTTLSYDDLIEKATALAGDLRPMLLETLAEALLDTFFQDLRVQKARVRVQKCDLYPFQTGVECSRSREE